MSFLTVKELYKSFGDSHILKGIDFVAEKGDVISIIGSSGSGKTTLLRCLNLLEIADKGSIIVNEEEIFNADTNHQMSDSEKREKRLRFGLVFQSFNLFPQYTALENVVLAPNLRVLEKIKSRKIEKADKKIKIEENLKIAKGLLEQVGLSDKMNLYPCQLSGGQQQRVAIARALALNPDILCFDEPTSALDPELTGEVLKVIKGLKSADRTMIIVTHEMEFARNVSDKIIFMSDGIIEEMGTADEIFDNPKSEKLKSFLLKSDEKF